MALEKELTRSEKAIQASKSRLEESLKFFLVTIQDKPGQLESMKKTDRILRRAAKEIADLADEICDGQETSVEMGPARLDEPEHQIFDPDTTQPVSLGSVKVFGVQRLDQTFCIQDTGRSDQSAFSPSFQREYGTRVDLCSRKLDQLGYHECFISLCATL